MKTPYVVFWKTEGTTFDFDDGILLYRAVHLGEDEPEVRKWAESMIPGVLSTHEDCEADVEIEIMSLDAWVEDRIQAGDQLTELTAEAADEDTDDSH